MKSADLFGLALRLLGLYLLAQAGGALIVVVSNASEVGAGHFARLVVYLVVGIYLLSGARHVQNFAYRERDGSDKSGSSV